MRVARLFGRCLLVLALAALLGADPTPARADNEPRIRLHEDKTGAAVVVEGLSKKALASLAPEARQWAKVLAVYVDRGKDRADQPAMLGTCRVEKEVLRFTPQFPLVRGLRYRAVFNPAAIPTGTGKTVEVVLSLPKPDRKPTTVVLKVYPTADKLPENQLKFYLHFSAPMQQSGSYRHIELLDAKGKPIDLPFLDLDQELWDPAGQRFTLFLDPGRIKRGLKPREESGPVLEEGKRYTLVIDRKWRDAQGVALKESFRKSFTVGAPDETQLDVKTWKLQAPAAGSRTPLRITFPKSMDHALLQRMIQVEAGDKKIAGKVTVEQLETVWLFTPEKPWLAGAYSLAVDSALEDLAGNSIARPFEVDVLRPVEREVKSRIVRVPFRVTK